MEFNDSPICMCAICHVQIIMQIMCLYTYFLWCIIELFVFHKICLAQRLFFQKFFIHTVMHALFENIFFFFCHRCWTRIPRRTSFSRRCYCWQDICSTNKMISVAPSSFIFKLHQNHYSVDIRCVCCVGLFLSDDYIIWLI